MRSLMAWGGMSSTLPSSSVPSAYSARCSIWLRSSSLQMSIERALSLPELDDADSHPTRQVRRRKHSAVVGSLPRSSCRGIPASTAPRRRSGVPTWVAEPLLDLGEVHDGEREGVRNGSPRDRPTAQALGEAATLPQVVAAPGERLELSTYGSTAPERPSRSVHVRPPRPETAVMDCTVV